MDLQKTIMESLILLGPVSSFLTIPIVTICYLAGLVDCPTETFHIVIVLSGYFARDCDRRIPRPRNWNVEF